MAVPSLLDDLQAGDSIRILVVDDDPAVVESLTAFLELQDWEVVAATTGEEALDVLQEERHLELVLLDVKLPGISGFDVLERSQEEGVLTPVVMISTSSEDEDQLRALGLGAQDYLTKPFDPEALKARIESIIGLTPLEEVETGGRHRIGQVIVDLDRERIVRGDEEVEVSEIEMGLLRTLLENRGAVVSRRRLLLDGMGIDQEAVTFTLTLRVVYDTLDQYIQQVREIIEPDPHHPSYLKRVFGQGYRLQS